MTAPTASRPRRRLDPDALAALEEQRDFLLRSLDDLEREHDAGELDDADYEELRDDYTRRAAEVLRAIDDGKAAFTAARAARTPSWPRRLAAVGAVAVFAVGAGWAVAQSSGTRQPGDTTTGQIRETASMQLQRAARLAQEGEPTEALQLFDEVLADDPENVEAHAERGLLLVSLGQAGQRPALVAEGKSSIRRAIDLEPDHGRAHFYLGLALRLEGNDEGAADAFEQALATDPPAQLRQQIEQFQAFLAGRDAAGGAVAEPTEPAAPAEPEE